MPYNLDRAVVYEMNWVDITEVHNGYRVGDSLAFNGVLYMINYVMRHPESGSAWVVVGQKGRKEMYEIDIPYEGGWNE